MRNITLLNIFFVIIHSLSWANHPVCQSIFTDKSDFHPAAPYNLHNKKSANLLLDALSSINLEKEISEIKLHKIFKNAYKKIFETQKKELGLWQRVDSNEVIFDQRVILKMFESEFLDILNSQGKIKNPAVNEIIANKISELLEKNAALIHMLSLIPFKTYRSYELPLNVSDTIIERALRSDNKYYITNKISDLLMKGFLLSVLTVSAYIIVDDEFFKDKLDKAIENVDRATRFKLAEEIEESEQAYSNSTSEAEKQMLLKNIKELKEIAKEMDTLSFKDYVLYFKSIL